MHLVIRGAGLTLGVLEGVAVVAAKTEAHTGYGIVVDACCTSIHVGEFIFVRTGCAIVYIAVVTEALGIKARGEDGLVAPIAHTSPQRKTHLMPSVR